jgi:hypothetical protein
MDSRNQRSSLTPTESAVARRTSSSSMDTGGPSFTNESATNIVLRSTRSISPRNRKQYLRPDLDTIRETIRAYTDPTNIHRATRIADDLYHYFQTLETPITGLKTLATTKILQETPIIAWREGRDVDVLAFCKVPDRNVPCSWVMHLGFGDCLPHAACWSRASVRWIVSDLEHLKELLKRAQHSLGILQIPKDDLKKLSDEKHKVSAEGYHVYSELVLRLDLENSLGHLWIMSRMRDNWTCRSRSELIVWRLLL